MHTHIKNIFYLQSSIWAIYEKWDMILYKQISSEYFEDNYIKPIKTRETPIYPLLLWKLALSQSFRYFKNNI